MYKVFREVHYSLFDTYFTGRDINNSWQIKFFCFKETKRFLSVLKETSIFLCVSHRSSRSQKQLAKLYITFFAVQIG
jgi:hypothetical protein